MAVKIGIFLSLGFLLYFKVFHAPFVFDDEILILRNPALQDFSLSTDGLKHLWQFQPSRFLSNLSLALNCQAHHLDTFGYHLVNWAVHVLTAAGVWFLVRRSVKIRGLKPGFDAGFWAALLFLAHPLNTEAVSYISQRSSALVALFYLGSCILYLEGYFFTACACAVLASLSKETAVTFALAWMLCDLGIARRKPPLLLWGIVVLAGAAVVLLFGFKNAPMLWQPIFSQSHRGDVLTLPAYVLTQLRVLVVYARLIFWPAGLNMDYDFPMSQSIGERPVLAAGVFLSILLYTAWRLRKKEALLGCAIAWFFVSLLPQVLPPRGNVIAEHKLYLTLSLLVPFLCVWLTSKVPKRVFISIAASIVVIFSYVTFQRNLVWADPVRLWEDTVQHSPLKARDHLNLGVVYFHAGRLDEALACYQKTILLAPEMYEAYINAAAVFNHRNNWAKALEYTDRALAINPGFDAAHLERGMLYERQRRYSDAVREYGVWLKRHPNDDSVRGRCVILENAR